MKDLRLLITEEDTWTATEGENENIPFLLRFRPHLQSFIETKEYNKRLVISWNYESEDDSLLPSKQDMELMEEVENSLVDSFETDVQAVLAFVYTGNNLREWHWYTRDITETGHRLNEALADFERLPVGLVAEDDEEWEEYHAVLEGADYSDYEESEEE